MFCFALFLSSLSRFAPRGFSAGISVVRARELYMSVRAARFIPRGPGCGLPPDARGPAHGVHQAVSGFSRRSYLHVNDGTAVASWLVIGFRLRAPLRRHLDAHRASDIDISLWRSARHVRWSSSKDRRLTLATFDIEWDLGERTELMIRALLDWSWKKLKIVVKV